MSGGRVIALAGLGAAAIAGLAGDAAAGRSAPAHIAAVIPGSSLESGTLVGRSGQIYLPAKSGGWRRAGPGGVACDVHAAMRLGGAVWVVCSRAPLFRLIDGAWSAEPLPNSGRSRGELGGGLAVVSIGRHVYTWKKDGWVRDSSAPGRIVSLHAESAARMYAVTSRYELLRLSGKRWTVVVAAPRRGGPEPDTPARLFGSDRATYAVTHGGSIALVGKRGVAPIKLPDSITGLVVDAATAGDKGSVVVAGSAAGAASDAGVAGSRPVIAVLRGAAVEIAEAPPLADGERAGALWSQGGELLLATRRGRVFVRDAKGAWSERPIVTTPPAPEHQIPGGARPAHTR